MILVKIGLLFVVVFGAIERSLALVNLVAKIIYILVLQNLFSLCLCEIMTVVPESLL